jgi:hypothetical protein
MDMKRILFIASIVFFGLSSFGADLVITAEPSSPILIPESDGPNFQAPYFVMNSISGTWNGSEKLTVLAILLKSEGSDHSVTCYADSSTMTQMFPHNVSSTGEVEIQPHQSFSSIGLICTGQTVAVSKNPFAAYHIPVTVYVIGKSANHFIQESVQIIIQ